MVYGYIRVSTGKQTLENQKLQIRRYCRERRLHHIQWIAETVSGMRRPEKRKLGMLLEAVRKDDVVVIAEISRLGRSMLMILDVLQTFFDRGVQVRAIKEGYELGDNIQSKVIAFAFGLSAEIERQLISERTKAGLERAVRQGKRLGRPKGKAGRCKLSGKCGYIRRERAKGKSKSAIARDLCVTRATLSTFMRIQGIV